MMGIEGVRIVIINQERKLLMSKHQILFISLLNPFSSHYHQKIQTVHQIIIIKKLIIITIPTQVIPTNNNNSNSKTLKTSKQMPYPQIQSLLFVKNYNSLEQQFRNITKPTQLSLDSLFLQTVQLKLELFRAVKRSQTARESLAHFQHNVKRLEENYSSMKINDLKKLYILGLSFFIFQLTPKKQPASQISLLSQIKQNKPTQSITSQQSTNSQQKSLTKELLTLPTVTQYIADFSLIKQIKSSQYLFITFLEVQTKKLIKCKRKENKQEIYFMLGLLNELTEMYPQTIPFAKKLQLILVHLRIYYLNSSIDIGYARAVEEMLKLLTGEYSQETSNNNSNSNKNQNQNNRLGMSGETVVVLLYNVLKMLLGVDDVPENVMSGLAAIFKKYNMPTPCNYNETVFRLFIIIKMVIFRQSQAMTNNSTIYGNKSEQHIKNHQQQQQDDNPLQIEGEDPILGETFSTFLNINLDTTVVQLKQVSRNIVRHRVASLATVIGFKLGIDNFAIDFLHLMHDSPFNNDIQTIKLCFELFQAREFSKLQHLFQVVLSASTCKNLKERQVLIAMCSIFIGIYLENRQEGLLYAKLNHFENKKHILREETLLQHLGFSYYNLAKSEVYLENRKVYLIKALQNFKKSYELNPNNYVVTYCMSKVYLQLYDPESAYKYAFQSCKCNRGRWVPFALLACVYMVQRKINKAMIVVDELIKKYPDETILYYIRAYIEVNKLLLEIEHDEEVEAAKSMDEEIYELTKDRVLKSKSLVGMNAYCQQFYNRSRSEVKEIDENFFNIANNFTQETHEQAYGDSMAERKALILIIELFIEVDQLQTAQGLLRTIPENQQTSESKFYHALIHSKRKEYSLALADFKKILQKDNMHVDSLIQCALLQKNHAEALNYITLAGKFTNDNNFQFAKGMILSRLERFQQAHECFVKEADTTWLQMLPEKLYYF